MHIFNDVFTFACFLLLCVSASQSLSNSRSVTLAVPAPLAIAPSQYYDGIDGEWSTFELRIGQPQQVVRSIVSTNAPQTVVILPAGCTDYAMNPVTKNCAASRGNLFNVTASTTWRDQGNYGINSDVGWEANLGYKQNASYGLETLGLGVANAQTTLKNQTVSAIVTTKPFFNSMFGIGTQSVNYSQIGNFSAPSYFTSLKSEKLIPSLSWSYTAGAIYRYSAGQVAQLIFGGYDTTRFVANSANFSMAPDVDRDLVVSVQSITYGGNTKKSLLSKPIHSFIESTDPNIWLPEDACLQFEEAFGLTIDNTTGLYLINQTHLSLLETASPNVTFTLSNSLLGGSTVDIVLPFRALALKTTYPYIPWPNATAYYFPLRKAKDESQYTLGRAFLQEAYLTVDYEKNHFTVSQCAWIEGATPNIISMVSADYLINNATNTTQTPTAKDSIEKPKKLSTGVIVAMAIAAGVLLICLPLFIIFILHRKRPRSPAPALATAETMTLTRVEPSDKSTYAQSHQSLQSHPSVSVSSTAPSYQKFPLERFTNHLDVPSERVELPSNDTPTIRHQLSDHDNRLTQDYSSAKRAIRAAQTPEIAGNPIIRYELHGSQPSSIAELPTRPQLSPALSPFASPGTTYSARASPRIVSPASPVSPWNTYYDDRADSEDGRTVSSRSGGVWE